jgi:hypothetical protein
LLLLSQGDSSIFRLIAEFKSPSIFVLAGIYSNMESTVPVIESSDVNVAAAQINGLHHELVALGNTVLSAAIEIGKRLAKTKIEVGHRNWMIWMQENLDFSVRTAANYLKLARNEEFLLKEGIVKLDTTYKTLCPPSKKRKEKICHLTDEQQEEVQLRAENLAESLRMDYSEYFGEAINTAIRELRDCRKTM